jgi:8-oxo-dGTP pyrophosphatase MutT (NUDIX family)
MKKSRSETPSVFSALKSRLAARTPLRVEAPGLMETAVALILAPGKRGLEALFIRRAERADDPWSGHIALPGGRRDPGDKDRLAVAVRETREEVGIRLPPSALLGALDDLHPSTPRLPPLVIRPYAFGFARRPDARLSAEVAGVMWVPLAALAESAGKAEIALRGAPVQVDCYRPGGVVIWGLTYRILRGFLPLAG